MSGVRDLGSVVGGQWSGIRGTVPCGNRPRMIIETGYGDSDEIYGCVLGEAEGREPGRRDGLRFP